MIEKFHLLIGEFKKSQNSYKTILIKKRKKLKSFKYYCIRITSG